MTGFDSVISSVRLLLFGMATVPVTHMLHTISANYKQTFASLKARFARPSFAFAPAMAFAV
jgi:hypothetical protein